MYQERVYRNLFKGTGIDFFDVGVKETDLRIGADKNLYDKALFYIKKYRKELEDYIKTHNAFKTSLDPVQFLEGAPFIALRMCDASKKAGVGPMAAVAGAMSELVGKELLKYSEEIIIENGGDIFIKSNHTRNVGIYAGHSPLSNKICIPIEPFRTPLGICTSSGTVGHSLSFGKADAAVVISKDTFLADAVATAVGNKVGNPSDIESAIDFASSIDGVEGVLIIIGDKMGAWGNIEIRKL